MLGELKQSNLNFDFAQIPSFSNELQKLFYIQVSTILLVSENQKLF